MNPIFTVHKLRQLDQKTAQVVDLRRASEFAAGHSPGAVHIPMDGSEARLAARRTGVPQILVCRKSNGLGDYGAFAGTVAVSDLCRGGGTSLAKLVRGLTLDPRLSKEQEIRQATHTGV